MAKKLAPNYNAMIESRLQRLDGMDHVLYTLHTMILAIYRSEDRASTDPEADLLDSIVDLMSAITKDIARIKVMQEHDSHVALETARRAARRRRKQVNRIDGLIIKHYSD